MDSNDFKNPSLSKNRKTMILIGLVTLFAGGLWIMNKSVSPNQKRIEKPVTIEVEAARPASIARTITAAGTLRANQSVTVKPQVNGLVSKIFVEGGQEVKAGDPILSVDDRKYRNKLKEAQAKLAFAEQEFSRYDKLVSQNYGSRKNHDKAVANRQEAEALVDQAKKEIEDSVISAPFEGVISLNEISLGAPVNENTELFTVTDLDPIKIDFRLPAVFLRNISVGQTIIVRVDGFLDQKFEAQIEAIDSKVDPVSHTIAVRGRIENSSQILKPGLFARVEIQVGAKDNALVLPTSSVQVNGDEESVYKVSYYAEKDLLIAVRQTVTTGLQEKDKTEILKGIKEGDLIVTIGHQKIRDGTPITFAGHEEYRAKFIKEKEQLAESVNLSK